MRATIVIRDVINSQVEVTSDITEITEIEERTPPTAAAIMALGVHVLFESGVLAQAGAIALKELEQGKSPLAAIQEKYGNGTSN